MGQLIDLDRQRLHMPGKFAQSFVRRDVRDNALERGDGVFKLADRCGIGAGAHDHVDLAAEIADRIVESGQLFGGLQCTQFAVDVGQRTLDAGQHVAVGPGGAGLVDAPPERAYFVFQRLDGPPRHRFSDGLADFGKLATESRDGLLDTIRTAKRLDLAGDLGQLPLKTGEIRLRLNRRRVIHERRWRHPCR